MNVRRTRVQIPVWHDDVSLWAAAAVRFPESGFTNYKLAWSLALHRHFEEALAPALRGVEFNPEMPQTHATLGLIELKLRRYADAARELETAVRGNSGLSNSRYNLACAYTRLASSETPSIRCANYSIASRNSRRWPCAMANSPRCGTTPTTARSFGTLWAAVRNDEPIHQS